MDLPVPVYLIDLGDKLIQKVTEHILSRIEDNFDRMRH